MKALFFTLLSIILFFSSCEEKDDFSRISEDYIYDAEFAIPAGVLEFSSEKIKFPILLDKIPANTALSSLRDTFPFDMSNLSKDSGFIQEMTYNFIIKNEFPVACKVNIFFANTFRRIIDQLEDTIKINAATISGDTTLPNSSVQTIPVKKDRISRWHDVRYIIAIATLESPKNDLPVHYIRNRKLRIEIGVRVHFYFNAKDALE